MKKGLKFTKEQLENLYWKQKLSLDAIGQKFNCRGGNILYWLKKFNISRRPPNFRQVNIPKEILEDLYWKKNRNSQEIADMFGIKNGRTIRKKLHRLGIPTKTVSQALTKKRKDPFTGSPAEKAYLLGLRTGDFHGRWMNQSVRIQTSTTHLALVKLLKNSFEKYGETRSYFSQNKRRDNEWFIYVDLHPSFEFLISKPQKISNWILKNELYFFSFLAAYMDCEGNWNIQRSHQKWVRFMFSLRTSDKRILEQIKSKLENLGYHPHLYLSRRKGEKAPYGLYRRNLLELIIHRKSDIISLVKKLFPLSQHSEKIREMRLILNNQNESWPAVEKQRAQLRKQIQGELLKNQNSRKPLNK
jgi:hypothetical protein